MDALSVASALWWRYAFFFGKSGGNRRFRPFLVYIVAGGRFGRYDYQLTEKPGWDVVLTFNGGSIPLWVVSFSIESELLVAFEA